MCLRYKACVEIFTLFLYIAVSFEKVAHSVFFMCIIFISGPRDAGSCRKVDWRLMSLSPGTCRMNDSPFWFHRCSLLILSLLFFILIPLLPFFIFHSAVIVSFTPSTVTFSSVRTNLVGSVSLPNVNSSVRV